jgi:hypothetical protein
LEKGLLRRQHIAIHKPVKSSENLRYHSRRFSGAGFNRGSSPDAPS